MVDVLLCLIVWLPLLLLLQAHYLASTPRVALPWHMQAGVLLINCMAAELLYRSVTLQVCGTSVYKSSLAGTSWATHQRRKAGDAHTFVCLVG